MSSSIPALRMPNNKLCNIVVTMVLTSVTVGNEVYDAYLCQATNFLNVPRMFWMRTLKGLRKHKPSFCKNVHLRKTHVVLSTKFVVWKSRSQSSHYQWLRVMSYTLMPTSTVLSQTFTFLSRHYCDNRHPRTFLWRHIRSHGQFARTAERSPHFCDACTLTTAGHLSRIKERKGKEEYFI